MSVGAEKSLWQNSLSLYDKSPEETRNRRIITQYNKGCM
jgi:hypothetical protein